MDYASLVTTEHADKPRFIAAVRAATAPLNEIRATAQALSAAFDLDAAVGVQLDIVGQWIGRIRYLAQPLTGVYFTLGSASLGFGRGVWKGPYDPTTGIQALPDDFFRLLLRAVAAANQWDGSIPHAYDVLDFVFREVPEFKAAVGVSDPVLIQDSEDMSMIFALRFTPNPLTQALLSGGYLDLRPAGVRVRYAIPTTSSRYFGFGVSTDAVAGFGQGAFGRFL